MECHSRWNTVIFFNAEWYDVYNFLEYFVNSYEKNHDPTRNDNFVKACNTILKQEVSAYRFVGYKLAQITSEDETGFSDLCVRRVFMQLSRPSPVKVL